MAGSLYHKVKALPRSQQAVASRAHEATRRIWVVGLELPLAAVSGPGTGLVRTYSTFHPLHAALRMARFSKILDNNNTKFNLQCAIVTRLIGAGHNEMYEKQVSQHPG